MDGGSRLTTVFDFPRAIANCMKMVAVGGHFLGVTPTNNLMGHGFYQFSPELFFRVLTPENGFVMERMIAFEMTPLAAWYEVTDPAQARGRVKLTNRRPTCLLIQARKVARVPLLTVTPQQSDYAVKWDVPKEKKRRFKIKLPLATRLFIRRLRSVFRSPFDPRFFRKVLPRWKIAIGWRGEMPQGNHFLAAEFGVVRDRSRPRGSEAAPAPVR